ncbi:telomerase reverse transcriptase-like [Ylistrum balloti]|uniref:telomerase reverse transcriptase-like n=1 Tax=Ylistrum balloti TaxID=509963 RepID=UPI0029059301|nr:telomerase reverse transcriptase-like [Ylistrum balloti]
MNILKTMYHEVYTLRSWFDDYPVESFCNKLSEAEDSDSFINFIDTTIVAIPNGAKRLSVKPSLCQHSHQREIIMRVIERLIKEMKSENVLALGFGEVSDDPNAYMSNTCRVECRHPNSAVNRLHFPEWKKVLSRIGDIMMEHLLENTAIFTFIPPSNYIQLTGKAIFDLWKPGLSVKCPAKELCEKDSKRDQQVPLSEHLNAAVRSSQTYCITEDLEELKSEAKAFSKNKVIASSTAKERRKKHWEEKKKKWKSYALGQGLKKDDDRNLKEKIGEI